VNSNQNYQPKYQYPSYNNFHINNNNIYQSKSIVNSQSYYPSTYRTSYSNTSTVIKQKVIYNYTPVYSGYTYRHYYYYPDIYYFPYYGHSYAYYYNPFGLHYYHPYYYSTTYNTYNYNYFYDRPIYNEYYKQSNLVSTNYYNIYDLAAEFDPSDWMPPYEQIFDAKEYIRNLDLNKLKKFKLYVNCSALFCVLIIPNFDDGLKYDKIKNRIYFDVLMRNYAFIDNNINDNDNLKKSQKICLIENILEYSDDKISKLNKNLPQINLGKNISIKI